MPKKINIVGRGIGMDDAPEEDCWGVNIVILRRPVDIGFDMHQDGFMNEKQEQRRKEVIEVANEADIPVYSCSAIPGTTYVRYPIEHVVGKFKTGFFSNAICYMIALALADGVEELTFYGVNHLRVDPTYALEKPGVDYWLGAAMALGVKCNIPFPTSEIGRTISNNAYGYELSQQDMVKKYGYRIN